MVSVALGLAADWPEIVWGFGVAYAFTAWQNNVF